MNGTQKKPHFLPTDFMYPNSGRDVPTRQPKSQATLMDMAAKGLLGRKAPVVKLNRKNNKR